MKALITGASGLLGAACSNIFAEHGISVRPLARDLIWGSPLKLVIDMISDVDFVVHAAASTNVEQCEIDPDACYRDNFLLTSTMARACAAAGVPMVYISSTGVYGDHQTIPYREYSETHPTTHHHRAKLLGENAVLGAAKDNLVIRTGWLFGGAFSNPKNFVARRLEEIIQAAKQGEPLRSNSEQRGCPTFTVDVADRIMLLVNGRHQGIFNIVNEGHASRLEYVQAIVAHSGMDVPVHPISAASFGRRARVSNNETVINWRAREAGLPNMPEWHKTLGLYIQQLLTLDEIKKIGK